MKYALVVSVTKTKFGPIVFKGDLEENLTKVKKAGYDAVELAVRQPELVDVIKVKKLLEKNKLNVLTFGTGQIFFDEGLSFSDARSHIRENAVERTKAIIELASNFNSAVIIGLIRGKIEQGDNFTEDLGMAEKNIAECLQKCLMFSEKFSTTFFIEPINRYEINIFNRIDEINNFIESYKEKLDLSRIGILADTFHMNIEEPSITESLEENFKYIKEIHFADSNRWAPGYGHIDFKAIYKVLKNNDYSGFISFEMLPNPDPDTAAKKALEFSKKIEKEVFI